jgi:hypothetical protein
MLVGSEDMHRSLPLTVSRVLLLVLIPVNLLLGVLLIGFLGLTFLAPDFVMEAIGLEGADRAVLLQGMRIVLVLFMASVGVTHVLLWKLRAIVASVKLGEVFSLANAGRIRTMAWALVGLELLKVALALAAAATLRLSQANVVPGKQMELDPAFSFSPWLAILLLFVLAQVFEDGTRMRVDLEGTV